MNVLIFRLDNILPPQISSEAPTQAGLQQTGPRTSKRSLQPSSTPPSKFTRKPLQTDKIAKAAFPSQSSDVIAGGAIKPTTSAKKPKQLSAARNVSERSARGDSRPTARRSQLPKPGAARALPGGARRRFPEQASSGAGGPVSNRRAGGGQVCVCSFSQLAAKIPVAACNRRQKCLTSCFHLYCSHASWGLFSDWMKNIL